jgi:DNA-binding beta-propeller fold protein YncE
VATFVFAILAPAGLALAVTTAALGAPPDSTQTPGAPDSAATVVARDTTAVRAAPADSTATPLVISSVAVIPVLPSGSGSKTQPSGVGSDAFGRIYVADAAFHRLLRYEPSGAWLGEAGALGSGEGQLRRPGAVAALGTLSMALLDRENRRVESYDLYGRRQGTLIELESDALSNELGRIDPIDLAADRGGSIYVADTDRDRVLVFDFSGRFARELGGFGARPGSFRGLAGIAVGSRGEVVVTERVNGRLQRLDPTGRVLAAWPLEVRPSRSALPVAADDSGHIAVADESTGRLVVFSTTGGVLARFTGLDGPRALAFHRDGTLLVAEAGAAQVRRLKLTARPGRPLPPAGGAPGGGP